MSHNDESHTIWIIRIMPFCAFLLPNIKVWWITRSPYTRFQIWPRFWTELSQNRGLIWESSVWPSKGPNLAFSTKISAFWLGPHNLNRKLQLILIQLHNSSFCYVIIFSILDDKLVVGQPLVINPVIFIIKPVNIETVTSSKTCRAGVEDNAMSVSQRVT